MEKRILFSTIECWSSYNSATTANTFMNLFKSYDSRNMASIYFRDDIPSTDRCSVFLKYLKPQLLKAIINWEYKQV